jgi:hypothetical protein
MWELNSLILGLEVAESALEDLNHAEDLLIHHIAHLKQLSSSISTRAKKVRVLQ